MALETLSSGSQTESLDGRLVRWDEGVPLEERISRIADRQHGVVSAAQLRDCGLSGSAARARTHSGRLKRLHRGVYAPAHTRLPPLGEVAAALLACGARSAGSHRTAAWARSLRREARRTIDVVAGSRTGLRHGHVVVHNGSRLRPEDVTIVDGLPMTSVPRTLLDCAPVLGRRGTERLVREAEYRDVLDLDAVESLLHHVPGHRGCATLCAALGDFATVAGRSASPPEDELLHAFREVGLSGFECNPPVALDDGAIVYPDFLFRAERLVVEADPRSTHDRTSTYRSDRRRDRALKRAAELDTMRFCDVDLRDPHACALEVLDRLARLRLRAA